jgi:hypothetical protein
MFTVSKPGKDMKLVTFNKYSNSYYKANHLLAFFLNIIALLWSIENTSATAIFSAFWLICLTYNWCMLASYDIVATQTSVELYTNKPCFQRGLFITQRHLLARASTTQKRLFRFQAILDSGKMQMLDNSGKWVVVLDDLSKKQVENLKTTIANSFEQINNQQTSN